MMMKIAQLSLSFVVVVAFVVLFAVIGVVNDDDLGEEDDDFIDKWM